MAIATGIAIAAGAAAAAGAAKGIIGASRASKAKREMDSFQRQELTNVAEGLRISTLGAEMQTQEAQRRFATSVDALRSGGVRGLVGGLGQVDQQQAQVQRQISSDLDRQQMAIDQMRAQDQSNIRGMQEQRESFDYQMLAGQRAAGQAALMSGIGDFAGAIAFAGMNLESMNIDPPLPPSKTPPPITPPPRNANTTYGFFGPGSSSIKTPIADPNPYTSSPVNDFLNEFGNKRVKVGD